MSASSCGWKCLRMAAAQARHMIPCLHTLWRRLDTLWRSLAAPGGCMDTLWRSLAAPGGCMGTLWRSLAAPGGCMDTLGTFRSSRTSVIRKIIYRCPWQRENIWRDVSHFVIPSTRMELAYHTRKFIDWRMWHTPAFFPILINIHRRKKHMVASTWSVEPVYHNCELKLA